MIVYGSTGVCVCVWDSSKRKQYTNTKLFSKYNNAGDKVKMYISLQQQKEKSLLVPF